MCAVLIKGDVLVVLVRVLVVVLDLPPWAVDEEGVWVVCVCVWAVDEEGIVWVCVWVVGGWCVL